MTAPSDGRPVSSKPRSLRLLPRVSLPIVFLLIELFDELTYGAQGAALPALRADLGMSYAQVGLLLGLPSLLSALLEPGMMLLGDTRWRRSLVIGGGLVVALTLFLVGAAPTFALLLVAVAINYPASGAFVTLAQASLVDLYPGREAHSMARWTVAGSLGALAGPLVLAAAFAIGIGWRWTFVAFAFLAVALVGLTALQPFPASAHQAASTDQPGAILRNLSRSLRNRSLLRWLLVLQFSDLMLDIYTAYLALYFAEVVGFSPATTGVVLGAVMVASLAADLAVVPLLERIPGRKLVRASAAVVCVLYPAWLLVPHASAKVILAVLVRLATLGWYQVLQGEAYASEPGRSGTVMALSSVSGLVNSGLAWVVGWAAGMVGLPFAMWILLGGPLALLLFMPRGRPGDTMAPSDPGPIAHPPAS